MEVFLHAKQRDVVAAVSIWLVLSSVHVLVATGVSTRKTIEGLQAQNESDSEDTWDSDASDDE